MFREIICICIFATLVVSIRRNDKTDDWFRNLKVNINKRSLNLPNVAKPRLESFIPDFGNNIFFANDNRQHSEVQSDAFEDVSRLYPQVKRKEYRCMSHTERVNFHTAIQKTKTTMDGLLSQYDWFVSKHEASISPGAHFGPAFAPWHRHYLYE